MKTDMKVKIYVSRAVNFGTQNKILATEIQNSSDKRRSFSYFILKRWIADQWLNAFHWTCKSVYLFPTHPVKLIMN